MATQDFNEYGRRLSAMALPALRTAAQAPGAPDSVTLGGAPAVLLLADEPTLYSALAGGFTALAALAQRAGDLGYIRLRDQAGHTRDVYYPFVAHLHLAAFRKRYESLPVSVWGACEDAVLPIVEPLRLAENFTSTPPPAALSALVLWCSLCLFEEADVLSRDVDAEFVDSVVHSVIRRPGTDGALAPQGADESPDAWTYHELVGLHALANLALLRNDKDWAARVREIAQHHLAVTQPDHFTNQPWGVFAFAWNDSTRSFADQQVHDATAHAAMAGDGGLSVMAAMLLADSAAAFARFA